MLASDIHGWPRLLLPRSWGQAVVAGRSMEPTLRDGDRLLVLWGGRPRPGRLAVVRLPGRPLSVKRLWRRVPDGWWVERDNPAEGVDSWLVGEVPDEDIVGMVVCRYWSLRRS
ncbi:MAG: S24/S26 family peptidase [Carbonactinosporaceae bacterium]